MATPTNKTKAEKTQELVDHINQGLARLDEASHLLGRVLDSEERQKDLEKKLRFLIKDVEEKLGEIHDLQELTDTIDAIQDTLALRLSVQPAPASVPNISESDTLRGLIHRARQREVGQSIAFIHRLLKMKQESNGPCPCGKHIGINFIEEGAEEGEIFLENVCPSQWWMSQHRYHYHHGKGKEFLAEHPFEEYIHWYVPLDSTEA